MAVLVSFMSLSWLNGRAGGVGTVARADTAAPESQFVPLNAVKLLDTRDGTGTTAGRVPAMGSVTFQVTGRVGIPSSGVTAVALNLIALGPDKVGWLTVEPSDQPGAPRSLTFQAGETTASEDFTQITGSGQVKITNHSDGDIGLAVAADGYFKDAADTQAGNEYYPVAAQYLYDTRPGTSTGSPARTTPIPANSAVTIDVSGQRGIPASGVTAVAINIAARDHTAKGWLSAHASDQPDPYVSTIDYTPGETNQAFEVAALTGTGKLTISNHGSSAVNLSIALSGYFQDAAQPGGAGYRPVPAQNLVSTIMGVGTEGGSEQPLAAGASLTLDVTTAAEPAGVPAHTVVAAAINVGAQGPTAKGGLTVYPTGDPDPFIPSVTFDGNGETNNSFATAMPGDDGKLTVTNHSTQPVHVQVSIRGYYTVVGGYPPLQATFKITLDDNVPVSSLPADEQQQIADLEAASPVVEDAGEDLTPEEAALMEAGAEEETPMASLRALRPPPPDNSSAPYRLRCHYGNKKFSDRNGTMHMRNNCRYRTINWGYKISGTVRKIIVSRVQERGMGWAKNGRTMPRGAPHNVREDYFFHGTFKPIAINDVIDYYNYMSFRIRIGTRTGYGSITVAGSIWASS
ncbi:hypothetical protein ACGFNU_40850 [Spirillospora sp. NPDC048911]|uniref:hypothetical protein n=1 Tax=Spirillospora sp. NPDC048911 TaxID=3364527 RepID=UPI00372157E5